MDTMETLTRDDRAAHPGIRHAAVIMLAVCSLLSFAGCGGGGGGGGGGAPPPPPPPPPSSTIDDGLRDVIAANALTGDPTAGRDLPSINEPLAQLGKLLFFSKSLSGDMDTACASCHHPALGGGDGLALPVGVGAVEPDMVGPGRSRADQLPNVNRHSPSVFNVALYDTALFWDSRIESIGKEAGRNGSGSGIRTPETALNQADMKVPVGSTLVAAQARIPVTTVDEMRGSLLPGAEPETVRKRIAARIGDYGAGAGELPNNRWLAEFQAAFQSAGTPEQLITFDNIALALGEYQRSLIFVDTPWKAYVEGNNGAISETAKSGALLFFRDPAGGGLGCAACHSGDFFTDERSTIVGFPQTGPGMGDGSEDDRDFGRERQTGNAQDRFRFRTPTLLNVAATAPYGHVGVLDLVLAAQHYFQPDMTRDDAVPGGSVCGVPQFAENPDCETLFPNTSRNSLETLAQAIEQRDIDSTMTFPDLTDRPIAEGQQLLEFLETLTDPCTLDRACLAPWIPDPSEAPDDNQLDAVDANQNPL
jgi:cytochrome c peroxidase